MLVIKVLLCVVRHSEIKVI